MIEAPPPSAASADIETIKQELLATFRSALGLPEFQMDEGFLSSGGDSLTVIETILDIEKRYEVTLSTAEFMALDTAEKLARHIASAMLLHHAKPVTENKVCRNECTLLSVVQDGERSRPLVCAFGQKGEAAYAIPLAGLLPSDQPVGMLQVRPSEALDEGLQSFPDLEQSSAMNITRQYSRDPCVLLGYSLGAHVALSVGHELSKLGSPPALMVVLDDEADLDRRIFGAVQQSVDPKSILDVVTGAVKCTPAEPIATRLVYFRSAENEAYYRSDPTSGWGEIASGGVTHFDISANHGEFPRDRGLRQIVPRLSEEIAVPVQAAPEPNAAQILRFEARRAARQGDLASELSYLNRSIEHDNEQPSWVYANLAEALFQNGAVAAALAALTRARLQDNWQLSLDLRFLDELCKRKLNTERDEILRRLVDVVPDHPSVHEQRARVYFKLGLWTECQLDLRAGLAMQPGHLRLSSMYIRYLRQMEAWPELLNLTERLVEEFPYVKRFQTALIVAYTKTGSPALALRFRDAIVGDSHPAGGALIALCDALLHCGRPAEALEIAGLAVNTAPLHPRSHIIRAKCLNALGHKSEARAARRQASDLRAKVVNRR